MEPQHQPNHCLRPCDLIFGCLFLLIALALLIQSCWMCVATSRYFRDHSPALTAAHNVAAPGKLTPRSAVPGDNNCANCGIVLDK